MKWKVRWRVRWIVRWRGKLKIWKWDEGWDEERDEEMKKNFLVISSTLCFEQNCTFSSISQSILNRLPSNLHEVGLIFLDDHNEG